MASRTRVGSVQRSKGQWVWLIKLMTALCALLAALITLVSLILPPKGPPPIPVPPPLILTISSPTEGETVEAPFIMQGSFAGGIPRGHTLWVLAKDPYNYYLMYPRPDVSEQAHEWSHRNLSLQTPGSWDLHVCLADEGVTADWQRKAEAKDWSGFSNLPEGAKSLCSVRVQKR